MSCTKPNTIPLLQLWCQNNFRLPTACIENLHPRPGHGHAHAQTYGLGKCLFGSKARCQVTQPPRFIAVITAPKHLLLLWAQNAFDETLAKALKGGLNARYVNNVSAYAANVATRRRKDHKIGRASWRERVWKKGREGVLHRQENERGRSTRAKT